MVSIKTLDRLVVLIVTITLFLGGYSLWRSVRRVPRRSGMMMEMSGRDPMWSLFGSLVVVSILVGSYALSRDYIASGLSSASAPTAPTHTPDESASAGNDRKRSTEEITDQSPRDSPPSDPVAVLPEDERRVLEPILESPGLTQVELRARSDFSKAKVSQTVSELENRGLIYRDPEGRTYRVYPGELLKEG